MYKMKRKELAVSPADFLSKAIGQPCEDGTLMGTEFDTEYFMDNMRVLENRVRDVILDIENARRTAEWEKPPADREEAINRADADSRRVKRLEDALRQMARTTLFALEHLGADRLAKELRKELRSFERSKNGFTQLRSASEEDDTLYSPVQIVIWNFAEAAANSFEWEYGNEFELNLLEKALRRTRSIMLFNGVKSPGSESDVRGSIYEFLRLLYDDVQKDPSIGKPGKTYKPDIGIKHLKAAVEYKYAANAQEVNTAVDGIYTDIEAYRGSSDWTQFFAVIYMTDEHVPIPELENRFEGFPDNWHLIVVVGTGERKKGDRKNLDDKPAPAKPAEAKPANQKPAET